MGSRQILVATEKHGTRYFDASTDEQLHRAALKLLAERKEMGWYYDPKPPDDAAPELTEEQIEALPDGKVKDAAVQQHLKYKATIRRYKDEHAEYLRMEKALAEQDGRAAWVFLQVHADFEYEQVELVKLEDC